MNRSELTGEGILRSIEAGLKSAGVNGSVVDATVISVPRVMRLQSMQGSVNYVTMGPPDMTLVIKVALRGIDFKPVRSIEEFRKQSFARAPARFEEDV